VLRPAPGAAPIDGEDDPFSLYDGAGVLDAAASDFAELRRRAPAAAPCTAAPPAPAATPCVARTRARDGALGPLLAALRAGAKQ
jgi:hypothetical protein